ncbi:hypothetical protein FRX31_018777 [Thalictrum thalictroides]|uniref:Uncharacterized protein n=1 Tax=Thalictrum thalictroides TaxID=46969 RepID=A0A7J6W2N2_THATH|nr:hypothetical protein FRX31_018777 [Thalictrum thalictroides]
MELSMKKVWMKARKTVLCKQIPTSRNLFRRRRSVVRRSVQTKVKRLQKIVPGGQGLEPDRLFLQTANYILHLRFQVDVLQALSKLHKA